MASVTIARKSADYDEHSSSYHLVLEATTSTDMKKEVFVIQRLYDFVSKTTDDVTVAIATPSQLEDLGVDNPKEGDSYYLSAKAEWMSSSPDYLEEVWKVVKADVQRLCLDIEALAEDLDGDATYTINSAGVTEN